MSTRRVSRCAAVALCMVMAACGGKPARKHENGRTQPQVPESAATAVQTPVTPLAVETTHAGVQAHRPSVTPPRDTVPTAVKKTFPAAASVRHLTRPFPCLVIRDSAERVLGYDVFSDSAGVTAKGYAGVVPVQVFLDSQAKPVRIYVLDNSETPGYLDIVLRGGLLERLLAYDPAKPESIDAVTLATTSSHAIIAGVTRLAARVRAEIVSKPRSRAH